MGLCALPDENTFVMPDSWRSIFHPRRGGTPGPAFVVSIAQSERIRATLASSWQRAERQQLLGDKRHDQELVRAARRYVVGLLKPERQDQVTPLGAAVVSLTGVFQPGDWVNLWVAEHGLAFAACAVAELGGVAFRTGCGDRWLRRRNAEGWVDDTPLADTADHAPRRSLGTLHVAVDDDDVIFRTAKPLRVLLAGASDEQYRQACEALVPYRDGTVLQRILTSYLAPTRTSWVTDDCRATPAWSVRGYHRMLACSVGSLEQLEMIQGRYDLTVDYSWTGTAETIVDAIGPESAAAICRLWGATAGREVLSALPCDEAFALLIGHLRPEHLHLFLSEDVARYPVRALRVMSQASGDTPQAGVVEVALSSHVLSHPDLVEGALGTLPEAARQRIAEIRERAGAGIGAIVNGWIDSAATREERTRHLAALAQLPTDEAFGLLADRITDPQARPFALEAARSAPDRAVRVLAARSGGTSAKSCALTGLLWCYVLRFPGAAAAVMPTLGAPARARVEAIAATATVVAEATGDAVPAVLAAPEAAGTPQRQRTQRTPTPPEWLVPASLPAVRLRDGVHALPEDAVRRWCELLAMAKPGRGYPGIDEVRAVCDPASLARFCRVLLEWWLLTDCPSGQGWVVVALGLHGDDATVRRLAPLIHMWPSQGAAARASRGLEVLEAIGSDVALTSLRRLAQQAKTPGFKRKAEATMARIASDRGLTPDELADRVVPDLGLDPDGRMVLDYGPRRFTVGFDEQLKPWVTGDDGRHRKLLPKPAAADAPGPAAQAYQRFAELKKSVAEVASERIRSLEQAMVCQRRWSGADFWQLMVEHPLVWHLTRRLVWMTVNQDGTTGVAFRIAEDRSLADVTDDAFTLAGSARVGVAHPLHLDADLPAWSGIFADYEILQPFQQLGRAVHALAPEEVGANSLARFAGATASSQRLLGMKWRGWQLISGGCAVERVLPGGARVVVTVNPGLDGGGYGERLPAQQVTAVQISGEPSGGSPGTDQVRFGGPPETGDMRFGDLDPVSVSEVLRDLCDLTA